MSSKQDAFVASLSKEMDRIARNTENWVERMQAIVEMQKVFEAQSANAQAAGTAMSVGAEAWRVLKPLQGMLQDLRSQIVKETCNLLVVIATSSRDAMAPFLREMLPTMLDVRGSGNKVCGTYCADCIDVVMQNVVVKGPTLKYLVDTLCESKNKLIRLSCVTSLRHILQLAKTPEESPDTAQLERGLKEALQDPSSSCRSQAYELFVEFQQAYPKRAASLLSVIDYKIQKRLETMLSSGDSSQIPPDSASIDESVNDMSDSPPLALGDRVCIPDKELFGLVRYLGAIEGVKGSWVGIELDDSRGKNDGSVKGRYYFHCKPKRGLFARPHQVLRTISATELQEHPASQGALSRDDLSDDMSELMLSTSMSNLELSPPLTEEPSSNDANEDTTELHRVLRRALVTHRKYVDRLLAMLRTELQDHQQFEALIATASSADAVQFLQQLQNSAQDKIVLSDLFIQQVIQAQQSARES